MTDGDAEPSRPPDDDDVALSFIRGESGRSSSDLSIADDVLLAAGKVAAALRVGAATVFVRADLPDELAHAKLAVERALSTDGLLPLDQNTALALPVARRLASVEAASWDLWGRDLADVFASLQAQEPAGVATAGPPTDDVSLPETAEASQVPVEEAPPAILADEELARDSPAGGRTLVVAGIAGVLLLAALGGTLTYALRERDAARDGANPGPTASSGTGASTAPEALVDYTDPRGRFTMSYPASWQQVQSDDTDIALLLLAGGSDSMLVRLVQLQRAIDPADIADVKSVTDVIVQTSTVRVLEEKPITLGPGVQGYYYLYTFTDPVTKQEGVHSHFFLFEGAVMHTLVFQALPGDGFGALAPDFDRIALSYRPAKT